MVKVQAIHDMLRNDLEDAIRAYGKARRVGAPVLMHDSDFQQIRQFLNDGLPDEGSRLSWMNQAAIYSATVWRIYDKCNNYIAAYQGDTVWKMITGWMR